MRSADNGVVEQVKPLAKGAAKSAAKSGDKVMTRVIAIARGVSYEPHPKRKRFMTITKAAIPAFTAGIILGLRRAHKA